MTIDSGYFPYIGTVNSSGVYIFTYEHISGNTLFVYYRDSVGNQTSVPLDDYTLTLSGNGPVYVGGTVTLNVTPPTGTVEILIVRSTTRDQKADYQPFSPFPAEVTEFALDKLTLQTQELTVNDAFINALSFIPLIGTAANAPITGELISQKLTTSTSSTGSLATKSYVDQKTQGAPEVANEYTFGDGTGNAGVTVDSGTGVSDQAYYRYNVGGNLTWSTYISGDDGAADPDNADDFILMCHLGSGNVPVMRANGINSADGDENYAVHFESSKVRAKELVVNRVEQSDGSPWDADGNPTFGIDIGSFAFNFGGTDYPATVVNWGPGEGGDPISHVNLFLGDDYTQEFANYVFGQKMVTPSIDMDGIETAIRWYGSGGAPAPGETKEASAYIFQNNTDYQGLDIRDYRNGPRIVAGADGDAWTWMFKSTGELDIEGSVLLSKVGADGVRAIRWGNNSASANTYIYEDASDNLFVAAENGAVILAADNGSGGTNRAILEANTGDLVLTQGGKVLTEGALATKMAQIATILGATPAQLTQINTILES